MVKIRLQRVGTRKKPFYRIVATDSRNKRDGRFIENLGQYRPLLPKDASVNLREDRVKHWLDQGAKPTEVVNKILKEKGLVG